jgi:hypothetical protein
MDAQYDVGGAGNSMLYPFGMISNLILAQVQALELICAHRNDDGSLQLSKVQEVRSSYKYRCRFVDQIRASGRLRASRPLTAPAAGRYRLMARTIRRKR